MADLVIVIGNKNYSSWSLRGWLALKECGVGFTETVIPLDQPESKAALADRSPSARVPVLRHGALTIWDSLAIGEYLAECFPAAGLWPDDPGARAVARAVTCEMHAGFAALRAQMPMDMRANLAGRGRGPGVAEDIARITTIWRDCRQRFGGGGDFLFGRFSLADAAFAPVVSRFRSYGVALDAVSAAYRDALWQRASLQTWVQAAAAEPWVIDQPVP